MARESGYKSQVDLCYKGLRDLIIRCEIRPGARLTERELITKLGYGRTPVREALLRLDQDRLVETKPRSGYRVRPLTRKSIDDFFVAWRAVALLMTTLAFERLTRLQRSELASLQAVQTALPEDDIDGSNRVASRMFDLLAEAADSEPVSFMYNRFGPELERIFRIFFATSAGRFWLKSQTRMSEFAALTNPSDAADRVAHALKLAHRGLLQHIDDNSINGVAHFATGGGLSITSDDERPSLEDAQLRR